MTLCSEGVSSKKFVNLASLSGRCNLRMSLAALGLTISLRSRETAGGRTELTTENARQQTVSLNWLAH